MVNHTLNQHVATQLARQLARLVPLYNEADCAGHPERRDMVGSRMASLETELTWHRAGTAEAALAQIGKARGIIETFPFSEERETLDRLLASIAGFTEQATGITREAAGLEYYGTAELDSGLWI